MKWLILDMLIPAGKKSFISAGNYIAGSNQNEDLSSQLAIFLGSTQVNERTDDDKTLVLATRLS